MLLTLCAWVLAWTRFAWFEPMQSFTFTPLWLGYVLVINALTFRRSGKCMLLDRPRFLLKLFIVSAFFWWYFEYLNRFVQNWWYKGIGELSAWQYFLFATLPFATVLPAVLGTYELLQTFPRLSAGLDNFWKIKLRDSRLLYIISTALFSVSLAAVVIWPDYLFPLLWLSPLFIMISWQAVCGRSTLFSKLRKGYWKEVYLLALAALVCGFFWEMWNYHSLAHWVYLVPYVNRYKIFEMPLPGYAGYLPFGLECAVVADIFFNGSWSHQFNHNP